VDATTLEFDYDPTDAAGAYPPPFDTLTFS